MDCPFTPFHVPENQDEALDIMSFLTDTAYTYGNLAEATEENLRAKGLTLWSMREFHNFHVWITQKDYLEFPEDVVEEHTEKAKEYHDHLSDFFKNDQEAVQQFHDKTSEEMAEVFRSSG